MALSCQQWERFESEWQRKYPELVQKAQTLRHRFFSVLNLIEHKKGLVPSLRIDKEEADQRKRKYIHDNNLEVVKSSRAYLNVKIYIFLII